MPRCLERNATSFGLRRARSHSSAGAVVRRNSSRSTAPEPAITHPVPVPARAAYTDLNRQFYSAIEISGKLSCLSVAAFWPRTKTLQRKRHQLAADALDRG